MPRTSGVVLITDITDICLIDGRIHFTLRSGSEWEQHCSISKHRSRNAIHVTNRLLNTEDAKPSNVEPLRRSPRSNV